MNKSLEAFQRLLDIMDRLRVECPWDRKQTIESLRHLTIEEVFELSQAIVDEDYQDVRKELGDIIMHIVFYSRIAEDRKLFTIDDVINGICEKLIVRHPHVFGDVKAENSEEVLKLWGEIKKKEKGQKTQTETMRGVSSSLPALFRALKVQSLAAKVGFDWDDIDGAFCKLKEEVSELEREQPGTDAFAEELGDLLFSVVNVARFANVQPELALSSGIDKFIDRFEKVENAVLSEGKSMSDMSLSELDAIWDKVKEQE